MTDEEVTVDVVAQWMLDQISGDTSLEQDSAVWDIDRKFGKDFVYDNENGNRAIGKKVLEAFRKISGTEIVWSRGERLWRKRQNGDAKGRQQD